MKSDDPEVRLLRLRERSAQLRLTWADQVQPLKKPLLRMDGLNTAVRWLYQHPEWPLGAVLLMAVLRPARTLRWAPRLWRVWGQYKRARNWIAQGSTSGGARPSPSAPTKIQR